MDDVRKAFAEVGAAAEAMAAEGPTTREMFEEAFAYQDELKDNDEEA